MTTESLKEGARKHEQNEEWIKALELYLQAIEEREEGEEPDIALHNRVGDLQVRMGDVEGAVASYETAIHLYVEADLLNNAIAICRKIIRNTPNRPSPFLRMGQIRARQGFLVDARQNFLTYAEMMEARGKTEEALRALEEFVTLTPKDSDTRLFLAEHLMSKGRSEEALRYFTEAYRIAVDSGSHESAERVLVRLREVAPDAPAPTLLDESPILPMTDDGGFHAVDSEEEDLVGFETTSIATFDSPSEDPDPVPLVGGFEFSDISLGGSDEESPVDEVAFGASPSGFELPDLDRDEDVIPGVFADDELAEDLTPLPVIDYGEAEEPESEDLDDLAFPLPLLDDVSVDVGEIAYAANLPLDAVSDLDISGSFGSSDDLEFESEELSFSDTELEFLDGTDLPNEEEVESIFDTTPLDPLIALYKHVERNPGDIDGWQRILEQAHPAGDKGLLALAYLGLASALTTAGEEVRARDAYRQLLAVDPYNPEALAALGETSQEPPTPPEVKSTPAGAPAAPVGEGYVDLGAMILGDSGEGTTRWVVSAAAPSGDESADFSRLLSQFKEQVARNLSVEDAEAHYDLGTAYKEMGLLDEAISEFQLALRAQPGSLATFEMLGQCFLDRGEPAAAVRTLERALKVPSHVEDDLLGIYYFMARSQEEVGNSSAAKDFYERIFALDINFKDVTERLRKLR